jgi:hypothetical protein
MLLHIAARGAANDGDVATRGTRDFAVAILIATRSAIGKADRG